ncbi:glucose-1-phosphate adenylyltransferase subunit GlgD [Thermatribacter velox]|uniref:Glucose-1-phosphate adenylyltransferase subunit GlgD n=1 Tax=Thermatribacter velox TaxID=3039681 RepID=A0ABZ2YGI0_9BACT
MSFRYAMILAGGKGDRLDVLSVERAKAAVPFGGCYRLIDFSLSNCVNSGIYDIGVLTQYQPQSLIEHIGAGRPWDLDRKRGGVEFLAPYLSRSVGGWYRGTGDALFQNLNVILRKKVPHLLVLSGDHVYMMNYNPLFNYHVERGADITLVVTEVKPEDAPRFGIVEVDYDNWILNFEEKPAAPKTNVAFMGIYAFRTEFLVEQLIKNNQENKFDLVENVIIENLGKAKIQAFFYTGCWWDVGTVKAYWEANMQLLEPVPCFNLYDPEWVIYTNRPISPPAQICKKAKVTESIIGEGALIKGEVIHSVIFPGVVIEEGARVVDSIVFNNTRIERGSEVNLSILDKNVVVGEEAKIGFGEDFTPNMLRPDLLDWGVNLVGKGTRIPPRTIICRNCIVGIGLGFESFKGVDFLKSGSAFL